LLRIGHRLFRPCRYGLLHFTTILERAYQKPLLTGGLSHYWR
jgi:hypothetical protein